MDEYFYSENRDLDNMNWLGEDLDCVMEEIFDTVPLEEQAEFLAAVVAGDLLTGEPLSTHFLKILEDGIDQFLYDCLDDMKVGIWYGPIIRLNGRDPEEEF